MKPREMIETLCAYMAARKANTLNYRHALNARYELSHIDPTDFDRFLAEREKHKKSCDGTYEETIITMNYDLPKSNSVKLVPDEEPTK